jgi:hypothetical protein
MNENTIYGYFGLCPACHKNDGFINIGPGHWFLCKEHKVTWCVGTNLISGWKVQTEEEQRKIYDDLGFGDYKEVKPFVPTGMPASRAGIFRPFSRKR